MSDLAIRIGMFGAAGCYAVAAAGYFAGGRHWTGMVMACYLISIVGIYMAGEN